MQQERHLEKNPNSQETQLETNQQQMSSSLTSVIANSYLTDPMNSEQPNASQQTPKGQHSFTSSSELRPDEIESIASTEASSRQMELKKVEQEIDRNVFNSLSKRKQKRFKRTVMSIHAIVTHKLYKAKASSLEVYFKDSWNISRAQVYRFLDCAWVLKVDVVPGISYNGLSNNKNWNIATGRISRAPM